MASLSPICHSLNTSVQDHRSLLDLVVAVSDDLSCDVSVWLPVFAADGALAALYNAAGSRVPSGGWALNTPGSDRGSGRGPALDAFTEGEITMSGDGETQHVPIFGCEGSVRIVVSVMRVDDGRTGFSKFAAPEALYRAVGRSGLLELADDFQHSPAILRALVASQSEHAALRTWQPDNAVSDCFSCGMSFTLVRRRHHCRVCLRVVCGACSHIALADSKPGSGYDPIRDAADDPITAGLQTANAVIHGLLHGGGGVTRRCVKCDPPSFNKRGSMQGRPTGLVAAPPMEVGRSVSSSDGHHGYGEEESGKRYTSLRELAKFAVRNPPTIPTADDDEEVEESDVVTGGAVGNGYGEHTSLDATLDSGAYEDFIDTHHHAAAPSAADLASSSRPTTSFAESWARDHQLPEEVPPVLATLATLAAVQGTCWENDSESGTPAKDCKSPAPSASLPPAKQAPTDLAAPIPPPPVVPPPRPAMGQFGTPARSPGMQPPSLIPKPPPAPPMPPPPPANKPTPTLANSAAGRSKIRRPSVTNRSPLSTPPSSHPSLGFSPPSAMQPRSSAPVVSGAAQPSLDAQLSRHNSLPDTLSASIVNAGRSDGKGLRKGQWRKSIGGTPIRQDGTDENESANAGGGGIVLLGCPSSAGGAHPNPMMAHAQRLVQERMQSARTSLGDNNSPNGGSDDGWD